MTRKTVKREGENSGGEAAAVFPLFLSKAARHSERNAVK